MKTYEQLRELLVIDRNHLDDDLATNSQLLAEVHEQFADALDKKDSSAEILKGKDAEISLRIRASGEKTTEDKIKAMILVDPEHRAQANFALACAKEAIRWQGLVKSYDSRGRALSALVELHKSGYWGSGIQARYADAYAAEEKARLIKKES
jgi:hypothetical protein